MAHFIVVNEFPIRTDNLEKETVRGVSVQQWLEIYYSKHGAFDQPMYCILNHEEVKYEDFADTYPKENDIVTFAPKVEGIVSIVIAVIAIIIAVYIALTMEIPNMLGSAGDSQTENAPSYSLQGRQNTAKLGAPISRHYGRNEVYPAYGMRSYNQFYGNKDHLYQGFCLGLGSYEIEQINIEDSPATSFGAEVQVVEPFNKITLIPTNVETSPEVDNIRVYGPNENDAPVSGWFGPFVANASGTLAYRIELDVSFPRGAFEQDEKGKIKSLSSNIPNIEAQYMLIDDNGTEIGTWTTFLNNTTRGGTTKVLRSTAGLDVLRGRYTVRFRRTSNARGDNDTRVYDDMHVIGLRTFLDSDLTYGDVTMLAMKVVATNNISGQTANRLNVLCTAKIPTWDPIKKGWSLPVATRSIVWAFCDILRSTYGANLADKFIDLEELYVLDQELTAEGRFFDWTFDKQTSVWAALKLCARNARAIPMPRSTVMSMKRDKAQSVRKAMFAPQNMLAGSLSWGLSIAKIDKYDGVEVEYVDPTTHKPEQVLCTIDNDQGDKPEQIRFSGCKDRDWAYREGLYMRAQALDQKQVVTFQTGFEGLSVQHGDLIAVASDIQADGSSTGEIVNISGTVVTLSEPVTFGVGQHVIALRNRTGGVSGLWNVSAGSNEFEVLLDAVIPDDYTVGDDAEQPFYMFGVVAFRDMVVTSMLPSTDEVIEITAVNYSARIFTFDNLTAPPINNPITTPPTQALPVVEELDVKQTPESIAFVTAEWKVAPGAQYYVVETSVDGVFWENYTTTSGSSTNIATPIGVFWVRVAAVNTGIGPWVEWTGDLGTPTFPPADVVNLRLLGGFTGTSIDATWDVVTLAESYNASLYSVPDPIGEPEGVLVGTENVTGTAYSITNEQIASLVTVTRDYRITVEAVNSLDVSESLTLLDIENSPPAALTTLISSVENETDTYIDFKLSWGVSLENDISFYRVWSSPVEGFTPSPSDVLVEVASNSTTLRIAKNASRTYHNMYWSVAAVDVWGDDTNPATNQTIQGTQNVLVDDTGNTLVDDEGNTLLI